MHKKILRIFALILAMVLLVSAIPTATATEDAEVNRIRDQIKSTYRGALSGSGRKSFHGYCATMVNWHLYLLGINTSVISNHGNMEYDYYSKLDYTSGGYRVREYSASRYNLKQALNAITENGTVDAYNILVGFQRTNTSDGRKYGHALFVHAILDGTVYFSESYDMTLNGKYYDEGDMVTCSIDAFSKYYSGWAVYEGLVCFGLRTYADSCQYYSSNLQASVLESVSMYSSPCLPEVDDRAIYRYDLQPGENVHVTGLYLNTVGEYWYALSGDHTGFVPASSLQVISMDYSDVTVSQLSSPNNLKVRVGFNLKGSIQAEYNSIFTIRARVYQLNGEEETQVLCATAFVGNDSYGLYKSVLSNSLHFRKLKVGTYRYELAAIVGNYYIENGSLQLQWQTVDLWSSQFNIVSSRGGTCAVQFDANGGTTDLNQIEVSSGSAIGTLPEAQREGYWFAGWYTAPEGGELVSEEFATSKDVTLYARWIPENNDTLPPRDLSSMLPSASGSITAPVS